MSSHNRYVTAIILAGGRGERMNSPIAKQNMEILGESVLMHSIKAFSECKLVSSIILVVRAEDIGAFDKTVLAKYPKISSVIAGGNSRAESAKNGFLIVPKETEFVAIHDAARCLITSENIGKIILSAFEYGAATAASPVTDTLKLMGSDGMISATVSRVGLYRAETPQVFSAEKYRAALAAYSGKLEDITDDNMLFENIGEKIFPVMTGGENIKITTERDLEYAEFVLRKRGNL